LPTTTNGEGSDEIRFLGKPRDPEIEARRFKLFTESAPFVMLGKSISKDEKELAMRIREGGTG